MLVHTPCSPVDRGSLLRSIALYMNTCLDEAGKANGNLAQVEQAVSQSLEGITRLLSQASTDEAMAQPLVWLCPDCGQFLSYHCDEKKSVTLVQGVVSLLRGRYRCSACQKDYMPVDIANDLCSTGFTLGARQITVTYALSEAFQPTSEHIKPLFDLSAKSVERIVLEAADWRCSEEMAAVEAIFGDRSVPGAKPTGNALPLAGQWRVKPWDEQTVLCIGADGGKVRSVTKGQDGRLEWFEARTATISLVRAGEELPLKEAGGKYYLSGVLDVDDLFDRLGAAYETLPEGLKRLTTIFVGDGGPWWERAREYFPKAIQILDIFHAAENICTAAAICFGEKSERTRQWRENTREWLKIPGHMEQLVRELFASRPSVKGDPKGHHAVLLLVAYLRKHRERMRYWEFEAKGLPIGSGVIESAIKQTVIARMRQAGMKWTPEHASRILCLRAAMLSGELTALFQRRQAACLQLAPLVSFNLETLRQAA